MRQLRKKLAYEARYATAYRVSFKERVETIRGRSKCHHFDPLLLVVTQMEEELREGSLLLHVRQAIVLLDDLQREFSETIRELKLLPLNHLLVRNTGLLILEFLRTRGKNVGSTDILIHCGWIVERYE